MKRPQISLQSLLLVILVCGFVFAFLNNYRRMRAAETALRQLRTEIGYLETSGGDEVAAVRVAVDEPLVWQARIRIPNNQQYRIAYSAVWREATSKPDWFAAQPIPAGESVVTIRILKDPRDDQWRISTAVRHANGVGRIGTVLPDPISDVFRGSHDIVSNGIGRQTVCSPLNKQLRIFDERYVTGTGLLLYGDRAPDGDIVGVFAELQPDIGPL